jgi:hypothetical protein
MRAVVFRAFSLVALVVGLTFGLPDSAFAVLAGQLCANADAGVVTTAENGATVQCTYNANSDRNQWVVISTTTSVVTIPAAESTTATTVAAGGQRSSSGNSGAAANATAEPTGSTQLLSGAQTATTVTTVTIATAPTTLPTAAPAVPTAARPLALTG